MHRGFLIILLSVLTGCTEVLREPAFELKNVENPDAEITYEVTGYDVTPSVVSRANKSDFVRYVNVGGNGIGPVRRVPESSLFSGPKPKANVRPKYKLTVGDEIEVTRSGFRTNTDGVESRLSTITRYIVNENGAVDLVDGQSVTVGGLNIQDATNALKSAFESDDERVVTYRPFPQDIAPVYRLDVGDIVRVSRLIETSSSSGTLEQSVQTSQNTVSSSGVVSILELGEIEAAGLTLEQFRDSVLSESIRSTGGIDTVVEIQEFASQSVIVTGDLGTEVVPVTDQPKTYESLVAELEPSFGAGRDFLVELTRNGETFRMRASDILSGAGRNSYIFDGDRVSVSEMLPKSELSMKVSASADRRLTYLRVSKNDAALSQQGSSVPFDITGVDLRQFLIAQGVDVTQNEDLLIRLVRNGRVYRISAQSVVLNNTGRRYWLAPDDHITLEDIAYVGSNALLVGEIAAPRQLPVNQFVRTTLAQALFDGQAFTAANADFRHVYVLRGKDLKYSAYHFDITQVLNLNLANSFELRPGDIVFVRTRPISQYTRALSVALAFVNAIDAGITNARTFGR